MSDTVDAGHIAESADYRDDPDAVHALLVSLDEGDRVRIEADAAIAAEDDSSNLFARGDRVLIDDSAEVIEVKDDGRIVLELDEQGVLTGDEDGYGANTFEVRGEPIIALWEVVDEEAVDDGPFRPVDLQVVMLNRIERLADE